jgi:hypothetical protein
MIEDLLAFERYQRKTAWRLHRVNVALSRWDEFDCAAAMPADIRPTVRPPTIERATLKELQGMLINRLGEIEVALTEAWGVRRN